MRSAVVLLLLTVCAPAWAQKKTTVRPDGTVVVEDARKATRTAACPCGPDCACPGCKCAPVKAKAPALPPVILPPIIHGEPVYVGPPVRYVEMPVRTVPLYAEPRPKRTLFGFELGPLKLKVGERK